MRTNEILSRLRAAGHSFASVGKSLTPPVSRQAVRLVALGNSTSRRIQEKICQVLGESREVVFGVEDPAPSQDQERAA